MRKASVPFEKFRKKDSRKISVRAVPIAENVWKSVRYMPYRDEKTGLILTDKELCVGCHVCENACPLQMIRFDVQGKMEKCDGCIERLREGREPACVRTCFAGALTVEQI